jgi:hypothetical protein
MSEFYIIRPSEVDGFLYDSLFVTPSGFVFKPSKFWSDATTFTHDEITEIEKFLSNFYLVDESSCFNKNGLII